ncbi:MAG: bifunctional ornithine acetyltransferase/N-acetylglutamate synthase [Dehalococcoidia bacterium]|nr:bifunctional ornithine acetyltransferase/N-acetylglutamate synthase [Dehalococcoidia bacterium]
MPELDTNGSATSPRGFHAGAVYAGMKSYGEGKLDLGILRSDAPCETAAVFTRSRLHSACVDINREHLRDGRAQAVVCNAGVANSSTGERGLDDARRVAGWVGARFNIPQDDVVVCSTGVIGEYLPMDRMEEGVHAVELLEDGGPEFSRAIMTTDLRPKHAAVRFGDYTLGGCAKGSGMIHPNMATMLAFLTTDAPVEREFLQRSLSEAVDRSFNLVSVDGDTSPSDTVTIMANGAAGGETVDETSPLAGQFREALDALCQYLAREIARDGEGATKVIEARVTGAASDDDARALGPAGDHVLPAQERGPRRRPQLGPRDHRHRPCAHRSLKILEGPRLHLRPAGLRRGTPDGIRPGSTIAGDDRRRGAHRDRPGYRHRRGNRLGLRPAPPSTCTSTPTTTHEQATRHQDRRQYPGLRRHHLP